MSNRLCSFCGKVHPRVDVWLARGVSICTNCLDLCKNIANHLAAEHRVPQANDPDCSFCGRRALEDIVVEGPGDAAICRECVEEAIKSLST